MSSISNGWKWIPTTYFAEGAPFMTVSAVTVILFKSIGMGNAQLAFWTSLMMLPWTVKPLWSPLLDYTGTKRGWIIVTQLAMALALGCCALLIGVRQMTAFLIALFFLLAFLSATHDVAADGFYLIAQDPHAQSFFAGIRSTSYRLATICVQGGLVALAGCWESHGGSIRQGWGIALSAAAGVMFCLGCWHFYVLPRAERPSTLKLNGRELAGTFRESIGTFFHLPGIGRLLLFLFFFRMAEALLGRIAGVFLIDQPAAGGLGVSLQMQGFLYGTVGVAALTVGGILGGVLVARYGFRRNAWFMVSALNLPDLVYVYLAWARPGSWWITGSCIAVEQFGYGLGYTAFMMVMLAAVTRSGKYRTSHFAFMTAVSILSLSLFGMFSGALQKSLGYVNFFWCVILLTLPSFSVLGLVLRDIPADFGSAGTPEQDGDRSA